MTPVLTIIVNLIAISILAFLVWRKDKQKIFWWALGFKLACGIMVGLLYQYYYSTGDTWTFFIEGKGVVEVLKEQPKTVIDFFWWDKLPLGVNDVDSRPRSLYFLKWVSVFNFFNGNNYWITSVYFSLISFFGSWYLIRILNKYFPDLKTESIIAILFIPSIVLWGSGVIKESIAIGFLFFLNGIFVDWYFNRKLSSLKFILATLSCWVLWNLKYYWLAAWLAVVIPFIGVSLLEPRLEWIKQNPKMSWVIFLVISISGISLFHPNFYYYRFFSVIVDNYQAYMTLSQPENVIHFYNLDSTLWSMLINSPLALISGLFRPFIFEARNLLQTAAAIENLALLVLFGISAYRFRSCAYQLNLLHLALAFYIIFLCIFLALSTPNFGTLSRYKIGFTPFLWLELLSASGVLSRFRKSS